MNTNRGIAPPVAEAWVALARDSGIGLRERTNGIELPAETDRLRVSRALFPERETARTAFSEPGRSPAPHPATSGESSTRSWAPESNGGRTARPWQPPGKSTIQAVSTTGCRHPCKPGGAEALRAWRFFLTQDVFLGKIRSQSRKGSILSSSGTGDQPHGLSFARRCGWEATQASRSSALRHRTPPLRHTDGRSPRSADRAIYPVPQQTPPPANGKSGNRPLPVPSRLRQARGFLHSEPGPVRVGFSPQGSPSQGSGRAWRRPSGKEAEKTPGRLDPGRNKSPARRS